MALKGDITKSHIQEFITKIEDVPAEEFDAMVQSIYEVLRNSEKFTKDYYLDLLVDHYIQTFSQRIFKILIGLSAPLDEYLFNFLIPKISSYNKNLETRHRVLILISNIIQQNPAWLSKIINNNALSHFFNILKNEEEVVILGTAALILVELIATLPAIISQCLPEICHCFSRLSAFLYKKKLHNDDNMFLHLNSIVYRLFFRLYAMYPCNFIAFLQINYGMSCNKENLVIFNEIIEPMLGTLRFHPLLITASKEKECDKSRWFYKEAPDILDECGQYVIDPIEFYSESQFYTNFDGTEVNNELCHQNDSITDGDTSEDGLIEGNDTKTAGDIENNIFRKLNEEISSLSTNVSLLNTFTTPNDSSKQGKKPEFAEEALSLSKNIADSTGQKFSASITSENVVAPLAIRNGSNKVANNLIQLRKNVHKNVCFSPFQPIKEMENSIEYKNLKNKSPISNVPVPSAPVANPSIEQNQLQTHDNEEVDLEIVQISYNLDNKSTIDFSKKNNSFSPFCDSEDSKEKPRKSSKDIDSLLAKNKLSDDQSSELVGNIKNSFKKANSRIRYQSHCMPESDKEFDYMFCSADSPISNYRWLSKSCPMLYFKKDDADATSTHSPIGQQEKKIDINCNNQLNRNDSTLNSNAETDGKSKINLILHNPDLESKHIKTTVNTKKTCKSVDFTKEARQKWRQFVQHPQNRHDITWDKAYSSLNSSKRKELFDSSLSMEMHYGSKMDACHRKYTPHQLLDRMLFLNSEFCHKEQLDRAILNNSQACLKEEPTGHRSDMAGRFSDSRRNSAFNINSTTSSIEHIPLMKNWPNMNEEDMRKQIAIMYVQVLFERHQRDAHVMRNRRLYKKVKECVELEEKYHALQEQLRLQEEHIEQLQHKLKDKMIDFNQHCKVTKERINKLEEDLEINKNQCQLLQNDKNNLEKRYKEEIFTLNCNYKNTEQELNKYLCNFNNNFSDFTKLQSENLELKNQLFIFGEYYNKIRDLYLRSKNVHDLNDKLLIDSLKYENNDLSQQISRLHNQVDVYKDKCSRLKDQLKQEETKSKGKNEVGELQFYKEYYKDALEMKDKQIESLKAIVVNYNKHISTLNCQIASAGASAGEMHKPTDPIKPTSPTKPYDYLQSN